MSSALPSNLQRDGAAASPIAGAVSSIEEAKPHASGARLDALFLLNSFDVGGSERKVVRLANELASRSLAVAVVALNGPDTLMPLLDASVSRWRLDRRGKFSLRALRTLTAIVTQHRPRVLFCVNMYPTLYAVALAARLGKQAPRVVGLINTTDFGPRERWRQRFYSQFLRRLDWLVYGCELQRDAWTKMSVRLRERAQIIYNGVDTEEFSTATLGEDRASLRRRAGYAHDSFIVGTVGRLTPAKNQQTLIASIAQLRQNGIDARLILVGEGPLRETLEQQAANAGVHEFVQFTGALADVRPVVAMFDVFVLPSLYVETFSNAALEAMAMSTPVILSRVGGAAEMVRDGEEGFLVEPHQLNERLPVLLQRLASDAACRQAMAARARQRVQREFSFHMMVEHYAGLIQRFAV